jgi:nitrite reductase/ring-hydroxylating ferredoxin subunit
MKSVNEFRVMEVPPGSARPVGNAAVFNVAGRLCATQAKCTHRQGPLSEGKLDGSTVTCPWHGSQFDGAGSSQDLPGDCGGRDRTDRGLAAARAGEAELGHLRIRRRKRPARACSDRVPRGWKLPGDSTG